jgi:hypothetical protein
MEDERERVANLRHARVGIPLQVASAWKAEPSRWTRPSALVGPDAPHVQVLTRAGLLLPSLEDAATLRALWAR